MARKQREEIELRNRPPADDDDEPKAMIVQMPEAYIPDDQEDMYDEAPDSDELDDEANFDLQI